MKPIRGIVFAIAGLGIQDTIKVPFNNMDLTWINGQNRQKIFPLVLKEKETEKPIFTGGAYVDTYFNYNFAKPIDNTQTISSTIGRHNEFTVNQVSVGFESNYKNMIGRLWLQFGQMGSIVQELDATVLRGRNTSIENLKFLREASAGYHFNKMHGLNVEIGIFMSYIGLESYILQENWSYQHSMVSDFTPFYFSGARIQLYPSNHFRTELWILNGWQSYNSWNITPGIGSSNYFRPSENVQLVANFYLGKDNRKNILRFHHDNSLVMRYYNNSANRGVSQAAFSLNNHYGFQSGNNISAGKNFMAGSSLANRIWFNQKKLALTTRIDFITNPGLYLAFSPSPVIPNGFTEAIANDPIQRLSILQETATMDWMPNDHFTFRIEYGHRSSNVPYFSGRSGTTSPDGWIDTPVSNWRPDLKKKENRLTLVGSFRL